MEKGGWQLQSKRAGGYFLPLDWEPAPLKSRGTFLSPHLWSRGSAVETAANSLCPQRLMPNSGHRSGALWQGDEAPGPAFCRQHGKIWHLLFRAWMGKGDALIFFQPSS